MKPKNEKQKHFSPDADSLEDLAHTELSGNDSTTDSISPDASDTDDDEDEGVGDGTMGRSARDEEE